MQTMVADTTGFLGYYVYENGIRDLSRYRSVSIFVRYLQRVFAAGPICLLIHAILTSALSLWSIVLHSGSIPFRSDEPAPLLPTGLAKKPVRWASKVGARLDRYRHRYFFARIFVSDWTDAFKLDSTYFSFPSPEDSCQLRQLR